MTAFRAQNHSERKEKVPPFEIRVTSYRLGTEWHCSVDNVSPGAVIARASGKTREEAERTAVTKAKEYIGKTRIIG